MLARDGDDLEQQLVRIQRPGGVVRVDDDDGLGMRRDAGTDIGRIWHPVVGLVADIVHRRAARQADRGGPQRVVRRRHQHLIAGVEQRVDRHHDQFGGAVADINIVQANAFDIFLLGIVHDRLTRSENALGIRITCRIRQVSHHVLLNLFRRVKAEHGQVADIQLDDLVPFFLHLLGLFQHRTADVIANVIEFVGFLDGFHGNVGAGCRAGIVCRVGGTRQKIWLNLNERERRRPLQCNAGVAQAWQTGRQKL
ncbi:hypothetical protein D3C72_1580830 [compost metagenome]